MFESSISSERSSERHKICRSLFRMCKASSSLSPRSENSRAFLEVGHARQAESFWAPERSEMRVSGMPKRKHADKQMRAPQFLSLKYEDFWSGHRPAEVFTNASDAKGCVSASGSYVWLKQYLSAQRNRYIAQGVLSEEAPEFSHSSEKDRRVSLP